MVKKGVGSYLAIFGCNHLTWSNVHVSWLNLWQRNNTKDASKTDMVIMTTWSLLFQCTTPTTLSEWVISIYNICHRTTSLVLFLLRLPRTFNPPGQKDKNCARTYLGYLWCLLNSVVPIFNRTTTTITTTWTMRIVLVDYEWSCSACHFLHRLWANYKDTTRLLGHLSLYVLLSCKVDICKQDNKAPGYYGSCVIGKPHSCSSYALSIWPTNRQTGKTDSNSTNLKYCN